VAFRCGVVASRPDAARLARFTRRGERATRFASLGRLWGEVAAEDHANEWPSSVRGSFRAGGGRSRRGFVPALGGFVPIFSRFDPTSARFVPLWRLGERCGCRTVRGTVGSYVPPEEFLTMSFARLPRFSQVASPGRLGCLMSVPRRTQRIRPFVAAALCLFAVFSPSLSKAALLSYTLSGGLISGTLGGTPFTAANWTITATANSSAAQFLPQNS